MKGLIGFALLCSFAAAQAAEVADYRFDGDFQSHIAGAPDLVELAPFGGVFAQEASLGRNAWLFPSGTGLTLDAGELLPANQYSVALQMRSALDQVYMKLLDTSDRQRDHGLYLSYDDLGFYPRAFGDDNEFVQPNTWYVLVMTRSATGEVVGYIDGMERFRFNDAEGESLLPASGQLYFLRDDVETGDGENSQGAIARLRLFNHTLTPAEVIALGGGTRIFRDGFED